MKTYRVNVEQDGKFWVLHIPGVERSTQARNLGEIDEMARDLIAIMTEAEPTSFDLDIDIALPGDASAALDEARRLREDALAANAASARMMRDVAAKLAANGMTVRDIGIALGVSYQRVHQLVKEAHASAAEKPRREADHAAAAAK